MGESPRGIQPWDVNEPSATRFICVSINGDLAYDWKDSNFTQSPGNIVSMSNAAIMEGDLRSWPPAEKAGAIARLGRRLRARVSSSQ